MSTLAVIVVAVPLLALPGLAALRTILVKRTISDSAELAAISFAGIGISIWALWLFAGLFGLRSWSLLLGPVTVSLGLIFTGLWKQLRAKPQDRITSISSSDSPQIFADQQEIIVEPATFRSLASAGLLFTILVALPFLTFGWELDGSVHRIGMHDWYKHLVVSTAINGSDSFPPVNPFLHTMSDPSYYFGFHLLAAALNRVAGQTADIYYILLGLTLLTAFAFPFVVYLFASDLCNRRQARRAAWAATFLGGFDILRVGIDMLRNLVAYGSLPSSFEALRAVVPSTHLDYWIHHNDRQFNAIYTVTTWAPQHTLGLLLTLLILHLLAPLNENPGRPGRGVILPAILLASLPLVSAYMALGLFIGIATAIFVEMFRNAIAPWNSQTLQRWLPSGIISLLLAAPMLYVLSSNSGPAAGLIMHVSIAGNWLNGAFLTSLFGPQWWTNLLDTPALYTMEFGIIGVLGLLVIRHRFRLGTLTPAQFQIAALVMGIVIAVTIFRPPIGHPNNLYARSMLLAFCGLCPFAALAESRWLTLKWLVLAVSLCILGTGYSVLGNILDGAMFWKTPVVRVEALRWINRETPPDSVVAIHPKEFSRTFGWFLRRPLVLADERHASLFGARREQYAETADKLLNAYASPDTITAALRFDALQVDTILLRLNGKSAHQVGNIATANLAEVPFSDRLTPSHTKQSELSWAQPPCFDIAFRNELWSVVRRKVGTCTLALGNSD